MPRIMTDRQADQFLVFAFIAWGLGCIHPGLGLLIQMPLMAVLAWRCDVKTLPTLMILMLSKDALRANIGMMVALRVGITLGPANFFIIILFLISLTKMLQGKYDNGSMGLALLWLPSIIPALVISFTARSHGIMGIWSDPVFAFLAPSLYFWGMSMGETYALGRDYMLKRLTLVFFIVIVLQLLLLVQIFSFTTNIIALCLAIYYFRTRGCQGLKTLSFLGAACAVISVVFLRYMYLLSTDSETVEYSTFSTVAVVLVGVILAKTLCRSLPKSVARILPYIMIGANIGLVSFVLTTQQSNEFVETDYHYETTKERFTWKLFGDRANVWKEGWEDSKRAPLIFKDMQQLIIFTPKGPAAKVLPHNQFITLISRDGWWLGLVISWFICIVQIRAFRRLDELSFDPAISTVFVPVGAAIFFVVGTAGQAVATPALWSNGLACYVLPGIAYGYLNWLRAKRMRRF